MVKLFEIPIYGLSRETLKERYEKYSDNFHQKYPDATVESSEICIELEKGSQRSWEYNHIVGYISYKSLFVTIPTVSVAMLW